MSIHWLYLVFTKISINITFYLNLDMSVGQKKIKCNILLYKQKNTVYGKLEGSRSKLL